MSKLKTLPTANYDFESLRTGGSCVYVDKTDMIWRLASIEDDALFFMSRPRRFGKSLMLSTFKCLFEGKKHLFRDLKIMKKKWDWYKTYPVVALNMSDYDAVEGVENFDRNILSDMRERADAAGIEYQKKDDAPKVFDKLIKGLAEATTKRDENGKVVEQGKVVILVDEYDHPISGLLDNRRELLVMRRRLRGFYSKLKNNVGIIRFLMMTGVSKFTKLSVFSGLNNLTDISMNHPEYATMLGYTKKEIETTLSAHLDHFARSARWFDDRGRIRVGKLTRTEALRRLMGWYDSYRFCPGSEKKVLNPVSVGQAFRSGVLTDYWAKTGMPTLIVERLAACSQLPRNIEGVSAYADELDVCDALELPWKALLYQSGYLTIKGTQKEVMDDGEVRAKLILGMPNTEVRMNIGSYYWKTVFGRDEQGFDALVDKAKAQLRKGDIRTLIGTTLYTLYSTIPPEWCIKNEADAKRQFLLFMRMIGARPQPECPSAFGYADAIIETKDNVYVFEFKYNKSAKAAIRQIREKGYADEFKGDKRPVTLIGINFRTSKRNIDEPVFEALSTNYTN